MSNILSNVVLQPIDLTIKTSNTANIQITPTGVTQLNVTPNGIATAHIVAQPINLAVHPDSSGNINITPTDIKLNIYSSGSGGGGSTPGGSNGQLQFNNGGALGGAPNTQVSGGNVAFTNVSNIKIDGGASAYFLQTDGSGNLTWAPGTANITGNGTAAGSNNQIQLTDGSGNFKVVAGFAFDSDSNLFTVPGNAVVTGNVTTSFVTSSGNVGISAGSNNWSFNSDGTMTFPIASYLGGQAIKTIPGQGLYIYSPSTTDGSGDYSISYNFPTECGMYAENDNGALSQFFWLSMEKTFTFLRCYNNSQTYTWRFDNDGSTVFPPTGNVNLGHLVLAQYFEGDGGQLSNINPSNISGTVPFANLSNFATVANTVTDNAQPNITSVGTLVNLTTNGNVNFNTAYTGLTYTTLSTSVYGAYFNGSSEIYLPTGGPAIQFGTGDFTVEFWLNPSAYVPGYDQVLISGTNYGQFGLRRGTRYVSPDDGLNFFARSALDGDYLTYSFTPGNWYHIAVTRASGSVYFYINGTQYSPTGGGGIGSYNYSSGGDLNIGDAGGSYPDYVTGYMTNIRIVNTLAVYTSSFTLPAASLTITQPANTNGNPSAAITGTETSLLTIQSDPLVDASSFAYPITNMGTTVGVLSPQPPFGSGGSNVTTLVLTYYGNAVQVGNIQANYFIGDGSNISNIQVANVIGLGNIATINLDGNVSNVLAGDGTWIAAGGGSVANANYANFAGNVVNAAQPNITSVGILTNLSTYGNINFSNNNTGIVYSNASPVISALFTGTPYILVSTGSQLNFGTNDFTVELWMNPWVNYGFDKKLIVGTPYGGYASTGLFGLRRCTDASGSTDGLGLYVTGLFDAEYLAYNFIPGTWYHIAVTRQSGSVYFYINGIKYAPSGGSGAGTYNYTTNSEVSIGKGASSGYDDYQGYMTNLRIVKNVAVYTSSFTPPGYALTSTQPANTNGNPSAAITGTETSLLTIQSDPYVDASSFAYGIINYGTTPYVVDPAPFNGGSFIKIPALIWQNSISYFIGDGSNLSNIQVSNISGLGNIATVNLTGSTSNVLYGNGVFAAISISNVANANYANFAGNAFAVNVANVVGIGNIATVNLTGSTSNVLYGNGVFAAISISNVANANYANFAGTVTTNSQPNITSVGTLSSLTVGGTISANNVTLLTSGKFTGNANGLYSIPGANVTGYVGYAGYANVAGQASTVYTAAQPNITSVGNLTTLNVVNYITTGSITAGVVLAGANGNANGYLQGNGYYISSLTGANVTGAVPYAAVANSVAGANVSGQVNYAAVANSVAAANISGVVANANYAAYANQANYAAVATYVAGNNVYGTVANANYAAYSGIAASANSVAGANVTGAVPYATTANSVAVANVVGIGNIATINLTGSTSNVLYGNGAFAAPVVAGANVTGQVNYAAVANSVAVANVVGIGNIATINLNGNASTVLYGNGVFSAVSAANANYANYAGTVTGYDQPNIHTLGNIWGQLYLKGAVGAGSITISLDGVTGSLSATNIAGSNSVNSKSFYTYANTYANRPSAAAGVRTYITDANTTTFHALVGGGGANGIFIYYDGTNWRVG